MTFSFIIIFICELLAILSGVHIWKKLEFPYKLLLLQVIGAFITEFSGWGIGFLLHKNNMWVYNIYILGEVWLLGAVCSHLITNSVARKAIRVMLPVITLFWGITTYVNSIFVFNNWTVIVVSIFYLLFYITALYDNSIFSRKKLFTQPIFLISISIIIYHTTIIPLFGLVNYLVENNVHIANRLYFINQGAAILRYALIAVAFYLYGKQARAAYVQ